jgi:hypothetical protein
MGPNLDVLGSDSQHQPHYESQISDDPNNMYPTLDQETSRTNQQSMEDTQKSREREATQNSVEINNYSRPLSHESDMFVK